MERKQIKFSLNGRFRVPQTSKAVTSPQLIAGKEESAIVNILFANRMLIASAKGPKRKQKVARGKVSDEVKFSDDKLNFNARTNNRRGKETRGNLLKYRSSAFRHYG